MEFILHEGKQGARAQAVLFVVILVLSLFTLLAGKHSIFACIQCIGGSSGWRGHMERL